MRQLLRFSVTIPPCTLPLSLTCHPHKHVCVLPPHTHTHPNTLARVCASKIKAWKKDLLFSSSTSDTNPIQFAGEKEEEEEKNFRFFTPSSFLFRANKKCHPLLRCNFHTKITHARTKLLAQTAPGNVLRRIDEPRTGFQSLFNGKFRPKTCRSEPSERGFFFLHRVEPPTTWTKISREERSNDELQHGTTLFSRLNMQEHGTIVESLLGSRQDRTRIQLCAPKRERGQREALLNGISLRCGSSFKSPLRFLRERERNWEQKCCQKEWNNRDYTDQRNVCAISLTLPVFNKNYYKLRDINWPSHLD